MKKLIFLTILLLGTAAFASPVDYFVRVELPPDGEEGDMYSKSSLNSEVGPVTPLPIVKPRPGTIPGGGMVGASTGSGGVSVGANKLGGLVGGGALPGGSGAVTVDPVSRSEREMKRLIRRLDR